MTKSDQQNALDRLNRVIEILENADGESGAHVTKQEVLQRVYGHVDTVRKMLR